jgi:hypothetical protein
VIRLNIQGDLDSGFDGASFINALILVIFISLLLFGSTNIPDIPIIEIPLI